MELSRITFATMTLARTESEASLLRESLSVLAAFGRPVAIADGGSSAGFVNFLRNLENVVLVDPEGPGLVAQVQASLRCARATGSDFLVYTEPDKRDFFERHLGSFIHGADREDRLGVRIASRDAASFATFPQTQQTTEGTINRLFSREIGLAADFCYGPLILKPALVDHMSGLDPALGWGWRFAVMGLARREGFEIGLFEADLPCPPDQRADDLQERVHRMRQLSQNLQGTVHALQAAGAIFGEVDPVRRQKLRQTIE
jgi:hypothetical protein